MMKNPLSHKLLRKSLKAADLNFKNTNEVHSLAHFIGQERAIKALNFGIHIASQGYNIFAMGPNGMGKRTLVNKILTIDAKKKSTPPDLCYIFNFENPQKPIYISLPPGKGFLLQDDMKKLIDDIVVNIVSVFESDHYHHRLKKINSTFNKTMKRKKNEKVNNVKTHHLYKQKHIKHKSLQYTLVKEVIAPLIKKLKMKYDKYPILVKYLRDVQKDILENITDFIKQDEKTNIVTYSLENPSLVKYKINLLVDNRKTKGAPIIFEENPHYSNLICKIEHASEQGNLLTNFMLIKAGSLIRANGGFLIIEARKIKKNKQAWEALKNALYTHQIRIEDIEHSADIIKPISLEPYPISLDVKVILIGERYYYYSLCQNDDDFVDLFKVVVDFDETIDRNNTNIKLYARAISTIIAQKELKPFQASAVAEIINESSRLAEDNEKLSTHLSSIEDIIVEADYWSAVQHKEMVSAFHVKQAIVAQIYRVDRSRQLYHEDIFRGFIIIKTDGKAIGQVNCLSVRRVGNFSYGHPTRVTARVRPGKNKFIDIQREIKLAGPLHAKAGLILSNFLAGRFSPDTFFSLTASISFEQVYCWTEGDSASVGEVCALLSVLAKIPIYQHFAVTGSIDQYGRVQAVGGINEKIEGFFDICFSRKLTGKQGIIIPAVNVKNLMLREDIVEAVKNKQFFIYAVRSVDQAIAILTGMPAGKKKKNGSFPPNTVYSSVEENLKKLAKSIPSKIKLL